MQLPGRLVLLGTHVERSLSPAMQNAALQAAGLPLRYEALHVEAEQLEECLRALVAAGGAGNVTIPHKERVGVLCDERTAVARRVGAVNTFWTCNGSLVGDNTDVAGFRELADVVLGTEAPRARVTLLGAGGAAAAVLVAVAHWRPTWIRVHARSPARARALVSRLGIAAEISHALDEAVADADVVVNATPVGIEDDEHPVDLALVPARAALLDLVYRRGETAWVRAARDAGRRAGDGAAMLVGQGAAAFERWFGRAPDRSRMWQALR